MRIYDLEFHVLVHLQQSGQWRYGWVIQRWLEEKRGIKVTVQSVYKVLKNLHEHGMIEYRLGDPQNASERSLAGTPRKMYRLSQEGAEGLRRATIEMERLVNRVSTSIEEAKRSDLRSRREG